MLEDWCAALRPVRKRPVIHQPRCFMSSKSILLAAAVVGLSALTLQPAHAAGVELAGRAVPGVCMLSREAVIANSKVGKAANARMQQLTEQARSQLAGARKSLDADIQSFRAKAKSMTPAARQKQQEALQQRMQAFQERATKLSRRIQFTRAKAMQRIGSDLEPVLAGVYKSKHCGLLLNRDVVLGGNMENDLTPDVVKALDRKVTTISFNLAELPKSGDR
jgi:Skp family chaperone for outer membrane proteins